MLPRNIYMNGLATLKKRLKKFMKVKRSPLPSQRMKSDWQSFFGWHWLKSGLAASALWMHPHIQTARQSHSQSACCQRWQAGMASRLLLPLVWGCTSQPLLARISARWFSRGQRRSWACSKVHTPELAKRIKSSPQTIVSVWDLRALGLRGILKALEPQLDSNYTHVLRTNRGGCKIDDSCAWWHALMSYVYK